MRSIIAIMLFFFGWGTVSASDSCLVTIRISCPKNDFKFWDLLIVLSAQDDDYFLRHGKRSMVKKGQYSLSIRSKFGDKIDTVITLSSSEEAITVIVPFKYNFDAYSGKVLESEGDTILIKYRRQGCCGGNCCEDRDLMSLYRKRDGSYLAVCYEEILKNVDCLEGPEVPPKNIETALTPKQSKIIDRYFKEHGVPYDEKKVMECVVKINRHIYVMDYYTYPKFRASLLGR